MWNGNCKPVYFSTGAGLIAHCLSCFKTFKSIIFYYVGQNREIEKNKMIKNIMKWQVFFISLSFGTVFVLFYFWENVFFTSYVIFVHVRKASSETLRSSRSQMFFKIGVLKNVSIFAKKHLCSSLFLIKLQAWRPTFY